MNVNLGGSVDGDVHVLIADHILGNNRAYNRRAAITAIDVDAHAARRGRIECVGQISGNEVADDHVAVHVVGGKAKSRAHMGVESDPSQPVTCELVVDDHVIRGS